MGEGDGEREKRGESGERESLLFVIIFISNSLSLTSAALTRFSSTKKNPTGEKDNAPMLYCGERVGDSSAPHALSVDVAVDPLDGTSLVAGGRGGAVAVIAVAERGAMFDPGPVSL